MLLTNSALYSLLRYFINLSTKFCHKKSLLGAVLLFLVLIQCISGVMLSFSFVSESMLIPFVRNEEDMEDLYTDDFFWVHERLVDLIFLTMYAHMYRKLNLTNYSKQSMNAWVSGSTLWLLMHVSIFLGLCLCCTHLSDITLTIAANIVYTFCIKTGKAYWWLFTNQTLNTDTIIRLAYFHYLISLFILCLSFFHAFEMHYDWKNQTSEDGVSVSINWAVFISKIEVSSLLEFFFFVYVGFAYIYTVNEILSYEIFMWGDIGMVTEPRFLGVAPHWYFRAYMGWLIVCPHHYFGIFGLALYMVIIYAQMWIKKIYNYYVSETGLANNHEFNLIILIFFVIFIFSVVYSSSILPYGKFYNRLHGNILLLYTYLLILLYLTKLIVLSFLVLYDKYLILSKKKIKQVIIYVHI